MKILLVVPDFPPHSHGGGGVVYKTIAEKLVDRGHEVTIIAGYHGKRIEIRSEAGNNRLKLVWIPLLTILEKKFPQLQDSLPPSLKSLYYLSRICYKEFDVVHLLAFGHLITDCVNLFARNKKILTIHAFPKYFESKKTNIFLRLLFNIYSRTLAAHTIRSAHIITTPTTFVAGECKRKYGQSEKIRVISNGIDLIKYSLTSCSDIERKFQIEKDDILIVSIARIVWHKGFEYALDALKTVSLTTQQRIKYIIIGSIEDENYYHFLEQRIKELGLQQNVVFTGFIDHALKLQALNRADIFLAPSLHEGFGLTVLEAMALGKPIIASNCEGFACILKDAYTGMLVNPANAKDIADSIVSLLHNSVLRRNLSKEARKEVQKYDWNTIVETYEGAYCDVFIK